MENRLKTLKETMLFRFSFYFTENFCFVVLERVSVTGRKARVLQADGLQVSHFYLLSERRNKLVLYLPFFIQI